MRMLLRMYLRGDNTHLRERREERGEGREENDLHAYIHVCVGMRVCGGGGGGGLQW